ncbi:MAG: hypothetical protein K6T34_08350 [Thermoflavifilum sp.]|nr:hypothetical protein [Thermoflavifilum sp.]
MWGIHGLFRSIRYLIWLSVYVIVVAPHASAQQATLNTDTLPASTDTVLVQDTASRVADTLASAPTDSSTHYHDPRLAALYSAVLPGLGQAYNHKYWKIPIAYAGLGVAAGVFVYNYKQFILFRDAYRLSFTGQKTGDPFVDQYGPQDQKRIRDIYRQYVDYSALAFMGVYVINIVDALVDAHLYYFNVSDNLTLRLQPVMHPGYMGYGLVVNFYSKKHMRN